MEKIENYSSKGTEVVLSGVLEHDLTVQSLSSSLKSGRKQENKTRICFE